MIEEQYQRALTILSDNQDKLKLLAEKLLEKEVIFKEDLVEVFGRRPWDKENDVQDSESKSETLVSTEINDLNEDSMPNVNESPEDSIESDQETTNEELDQSNSEELGTPEDKVGE